MTALILVDVLLTLGLTLRVVRFVVGGDTLGEWWIQNPIQRWADAFDPDWRDDVIEDREPHGRGKIASGMACPWCIGFWIGCMTVGSLYVVGGPGDAAEWWRWVAGAFTLNYVAAHVGPRLGDTGEATT